MIIPFAWKHFAPLQQRPPISIKIINIYIRGTIQHKWISITVHIHEKGGNQRKKKQNTELPTVTFPPFLLPRPSIPRNREWRASCWYFDLNFFAENTALTGVQILKSECVGLCRPPPPHAAQQPSRNSINQKPIRLLYHSINSQSIIAFVGCHAPVRQGCHCGRLFEN